MKRFSREKSARSEKIKKERKKERKNRNCIFLEDG